MLKWCHVSVMAWRLKSLVTVTYQANNKEYIKAPRYCPSVRGIIWLPKDSPQKVYEMRQAFLCPDVIMLCWRNTMTTVAVLLVRITGKQPIDAQAIIWTNDGSYFGLNMKTAHLNDPRTHSASSLRDTKPSLLVSISSMISLSCWRASLGLRLPFWREPREGK